MYPKVAIGLVAPHQDYRDTSGDFTIRKATVSEFDTHRLDFSDWSTYEELTKAEIEAEKCLEVVISEALTHGEHQRHERVRELEAIYGTAEIDWESRSPK